MKYCKTFISHHGHILFAKTIDIFLVCLSNVPWRPYTQTNFLVQKLARLALEQSCLARENCPFFDVHMYTNLSRKLACLYEALDNILPSPFAFHSVSPAYNFLNNFSIKHMQPLSPPPPLQFNARISKQSILLTIVNVRPTL